MHNETREAAWKYARCKNHDDRQGEDRSIRDFEAGAAWATRNLRRIPVTEKLPERQQACLFVVDVKNSHDNGRILGGIYTGNPDDFTKYEFATPGVTYTASHWCPYPEQLLKSIP